LQSKKTQEAKIVVMVLEPDVIVRTEIADYLRECGYRVIEGVTAADTWAIIAAKIKVDIVFSEVHLAGGTDGFALARRLRQIQPGIDVILVSGVAGAAEKCKDLCEDGPFDKPYRSEDVVARIQLLLERRRSASKAK
jgi:DNA-binding response OmpR family regulator